MYAIRSYYDEQKAAWDEHYDPIGEAFREARPTSKALGEWKYQRYMRDYLASVAAIDEGVGRLLDYLDENDLAENTVITSYSIHYTKLYDCRSNP